MSINARKIMHRRDDVSEEYRHTGPVATKGTILLGTALDFRRDAVRRLVGRWPRVVQNNGYSAITRKRGYQNLD